MTARRRVAIACVVVASLALASVVAYRGIQRWWDDQPVPTVELTTQRFVREVVAEGNLRAVKATPLVAPPRARGPLKIAWLAPDGSHVEQGQVVVRFDATEILKQLEDGEASRDTATSKIRKEQVQVDTALRSRDRTAEQARRDLENTRKFQSRDELIFGRNQIIESEIDEELSTAKMEHAQGAKTIERSVSQSKLDLLAIERRAAELKIKQARERLKELEITAPHSGLFVLKRDWRGNKKRVGDQVWSGQPLAELPLVEDMEAEVFVLEADASGLAEGRAASVALEAHPGVRYAGEIKRVGTLAQPRFPDVPIQYFSVTLKLDRTDSQVMKPGGRVTARLTLDDRQAVVVPRQAVFEVEGDSVVYRLTDGRFEPVKVTLGPATPGRVVVEDGVSQGDRISLSDPTKPLDQAGAGDHGQESSSPSVGAR